MPEYCQILDPEGTGVRGLKSQRELDGVWTESGTKKGRVWLQYHCTVPSFWLSASLEFGAELRQPRGVHIEEAYDREDVSVTTRNRVYVHSNDDRRIRRVDINERFVGRNGEGIKSIFGLSIYGTWEVLYTQSGSGIQVQNWVMGSVVSDVKW